MLRIWASIEPKVILSVPSGPITTIAILSGRLPAAATMRPQKVSFCSCSATVLTNKSAFIIHSLSKVPQPIGQKRPLRREIPANSTLFGWHNHCENRTRSSRLVL
jgi:hypothetical protein